LRVEGRWLVVVGVVGDKAMHEETTHRRKVRAEEGEDYMQRWKER
jgi:hypothetical protein